MHVQYVALCDQVILAADGRPSLIGVFNDLSVSQIPTTIPRITFAARILFTNDELGKTRRVEVLITGPDGKEIGRPGGDLQLPAPQGGIDTLAVDVPLQFDFFELQATGRYTFLLHVDGAPSAAAQLAVRQAAVA
jgi:hypothetical protein